MTYSRPARAAVTPATPNTSATSATPAASTATAATLPDGLLKTTPTGHESCFNCHWQDGGEKPFSSDCAGCHKLMPPGKAPAPAAGRDADAQLAARAGFSDPTVLTNEEAYHRNCNTCHDQAVEKRKVANAPTTNECLKCHTGK